MEGHKDERSEAFFVFVKRQNVSLVHFALNVAEKVAPPNVLKEKKNHEIAY